jgi:hypothetical protein
MERDLPSQISQSVLSLERVEFFSDSLDRIFLTRVAFMNPSSNYKATYVFIDALKETVEINHYKIPDSDLPPLFQVYSLSIHRIRTAYLSTWKTGK